MSDILRMGMVDWKFYCVGTNGNSAAFNIVHNIPSAIQLFLLDYQNVCYLFRASMVDQKISSNAGIGENETNWQLSCSKLTSWVWEVYLCKRLCKAPIAKANRKTERALKCVYSKIITGHDCVASFQQVSGFGNLFFRFSLFINIGIEYFTSWTFLLKVGREKPPMPVTC